MGFALTQGAQRSITCNLIEEPRSSMEFPIQGSPVSQNLCLLG